MEARKADAMCYIGKDGKTSDGYVHGFAERIRRIWRRSDLFYVLERSRSSGGIPSTAVWMVIQEVLIHMDVCVCRMPI